MKQVLKNVRDSLVRKLMKGQQHRMAFLEYAERQVLPRCPTKFDESYVPGHQVGSAGIELNIDGQLRLLESWRDEAHQSLFLSLIHI